MVVSDSTGWHLLQAQKKSSSRTRSSIYAQLPGTSAWLWRAHTSSPLWHRQSGQQAEVTAQPSEKGYQDHIGSTEWQQRWHDIKIAGPTKVEQETVQQVCLASCWTAWPTGASLV